MTTYKVEKVSINVISISESFDRSCYLDQGRDTPSHLSDGLQDSVVKAHLMKGQGLVVIVALTFVLFSKNNGSETGLFVNDQNGATTFSIIRKLLQLSI